MNNACVVNGNVPITHLDDTPEHNGSHYTWWFRHHNKIDGKVSLHHCIAGTTVTLMNFIAPYLFEFLGLAISGS